MYFLQRKHNKRDANLRRSRDRKKLDNHLGVSVIKTLMKTF